MNDPPLTPAELSALEAAFGAEVENGASCPVVFFGQQADTAHDLHKRGYLETREGAGYYLTHKGRIAFCRSCG